MTKLQVFKTAESPPDCFSIPTKIFHSEVARLFYVVNFKISISNSVKIIFTLICIFIFYLP